LSYARPNTERINIPDKQLILGNNHFVRKQLVEFGWKKITICYFFYQKNNMAEFPNVKLNERVDVISEFRDVWYCCLVLLYHVHKQEKICRSYKMCKQPTWWWNPLIFCVLVFPNWEFEKVGDATSFSPRLRSIMWDLRTLARVAKTIREKTKPFRNSGGRGSNRTLSTTLTKVLVLQDIKWVIYMYIIYNMVFWWNYYKTITFWRYLYIIYHIHIPGGSSFM